MKIEPNKLYFFIIFLFGIMDVMAKPDPPNPFGRKKPPPPPGLPIDENISILMIIALLFGIYIVYRHYIKTKTTI